MVSHTHEKIPKWPTARPHMRSHQVLEPCAVLLAQQATAPTWFEYPMKLCHCSRYAGHIAQAISHGGSMELPRPKGQVHRIPLHPSALRAGV
eukprot:987635-Pelagomonas_calceolata.AAC.2